MEKEITYASIERITYKFTKGEIIEALMKAWEIKKPLGAGVEFDFDEDEGQAYLIIEQKIKVKT